MPEVRITKGYFLQVGAFAVKANADALRDKLRGQLDSAVELVIIKPQGKLGVVLVGPWPAPADARPTAQHLQERHDIAAILVHGEVESTVEQ